MGNGSSFHRAHLGPHRSSHESKRDAFRPRGLGHRPPALAPDCLADPLLVGIARVHCEHTDDPPQRHHTPLSLECATGPPEPSPHARGHMSTASPARCQGRGPIRRPPAPFSPAESEPTPSSADGSQAVLARATSLKFWSRSCHSQSPARTPLTTHPRAPSGTRADRATAPRPHLPRSPGVDQGPPGGEQTHSHQRVKAEGGKEGMS